MSQRQRRVKERKRERTQGRGPSKRQVIAGASIAMGATLAATGSAQAATLTVSNLNDSGPGSLRQAILDANQNGPGSDDIVFASGLTGTIDVGSTANAGLYALTAMNIQGPGADKITLRGDSANIDYVVYTGSFGGSDGGSAGDPVTLSGLTVTGGNAIGNVDPSYTSGGGIWNEDFNLTVSNAVITGNHADDNGGGIYSAATTAGSLTLNNTTVSDNTGGSDDFGVYGGGINSGAPTVIRNSTISGNKVGSDGPGVYMTYDAPLTIENSTIANNVATGSGSDVEGGGVWVAGGTLDIKSSTITGNSVGGSKGQGGGVYTDLDASDVHIQNTVIADNHGTQGNDLYLLGGGEIGFSLIKDPSDSGTPPFTTTGPNITGVDPQLNGLANNGGPTQTQLPSSGSPVIDKGNAFGLNSDQRGVLRPIDFPAIPNAADGADMGAVELQPSSAFQLGKLKRNKKKGTAKQVVILPLPDAGSVTIKGKGLKTKTRQVTGVAKVKLPVIAKGKKRKSLNRSGKAKIKSQITYNATGNVLTTLKKKLKLLKR
jgi:hypothetical protein